MTEIEQKVLVTLSNVLTKLSDQEKERLLAFGEGMAFKAEQQAKE